MKLSQQFGVDPELAEQLEQAHVHTLEDLANVADLRELSARSQAPLELLERWQPAAKLKVVALRRRRGAVKLLVAFTAVLLAAIAVWSYKRGLSNRLDEAVNHYNRANALYDKGDYDRAIAEYRNALASKPDFANVHYNLAAALRSQRRS